MQTNSYLFYETYANTTTVKMRCFKFEIKFLISHYFILCLYTKLLTLHFDMKRVSTSNIHLNTLKFETLDTYLYI